MERAIETRMVVRYRSSWLRAVLAGGFLVAVAVLGIVLLVLSLDDLAYFRSEIPHLIQGLVDEDELARRVADSVVPGILQLICSLLALIFFAAWLSRATMNVPALGGGTPNATPTKAFIYPFIPVLNLIKVPGMIQDVLYRLDPRAGGFFMILIAWVGLVGSALISFVVGIWVNLRIASIVDNAKTIDEAVGAIQGVYDIEVLVEILTTIMISIGAIVLVFVIIRIETRAQRRDREIRAAATAAIASEVNAALDPQGPSVAAAGTIASVAAAGDPAVDRPVGAAAVTAAVLGPDLDSAPVGTTGDEATGPDPDATLIGTTVSATALGTSPTLADPAPAAAAAAATAGPSATAAGLAADPEPRFAPPPPVPVVHGPGPHLALEVGTDGRIRASIEGDAPDVIDLTELRHAADTLFRSGGTASVTTAGPEEDLRGAQGRGHRHPARCRGDAERTLATRSIVRDVVVRHRTQPDRRAARIHG